MEFIDVEYRAIPYMPVPVIILKYGIPVPSTCTWPEYRIKIGTVSPAEKAPPILFKFGPTDFWTIFGAIPTMLILRLIWYKISTGKVIIASIKGYLDFLRRYSNCCVCCTLSGCTKEYSLDKIDALPLFLS